MRIEESNNESLDLIFPIPFERVGVEINQRCNLHCKYCWNQKWNNREIEEEKIQKIFSALYQSSLTWGISNNPIHVCFYAAEPMLSADLIKKIIKYPFYYSFLTNGTLLDKNYDWLAARNLSVSVSLDGIKENHNYFRGDFDKIVNNIIHYPYQNNINISMTVNIKSLSYLYDSLVFIYNLPIGCFECHLNLHDDWTDDLFQQYIDIISIFIENYKDKLALPGYELSSRFSNYGNANNYKKDRGGPLLQINVDGTMLIEKPNRSCLILPEKNNLFFGHIFANENGFLSASLKQQYLNFMKEEYLKYNYISDNCPNCKYSYICSQNRDIEVFLYPKECYPILESFILQERFWK